MSRSKDFQPDCQQPSHTAQTGSGSHATGNSTASGIYATYTSNPDGPFHLVINFDASVANAPTGFIAGVEKAADFFTSHYSNATTVTIDVGYGEVDGFKIGGSALGESITNYAAASSYSTLAADFNATAAHDASSGPTIALPTIDPVSGKHTYWVTTAEGKAIGLLANSSSVDGYVGFSSAKGIFDYNTADGVTGYDFSSVVAHEISEVMGRQVLVGEKSQGIPGYMPLDLFHYSSAGTRDFVGTTAGYFSLDQGSTDLKDFNNHSSGDYGDWLPGTSADSFDASGGLNQPAPVTNADYLVMEASGWIGTGFTSSDWT